MTKIEALEGSVKKWHKIAYENGSDMERLNCPLCKLYFEGDGEKSCIGCPVKTKTGHSGCIGSPYHDWYRHMTMHDTRKVECPTCKILAVKELRFLKNLLREEIKKTA